MTTHEITNMQQTEGLALRIYKEIEVANQSRLLALRGDLGSGKTTFTQALARAMGVTEAVTSPTFVILKEYAASNGWSLVHMDAYRLDDEKDLVVLGWEKYLDSPKTIIVVEWAEIVEKALPDTAIKLAFELQSDDRRVVMRS